MIVILLIAATSGLLSLVLLVGSQRRNASLDVVLNALVAANATHATSAVTLPPPATAVRPEDLQALARDGWIELLPDGRAFAPGDTMERLRATRRTRMFLVLPLAVAVPLLFAYLFQMRANG